MAKNKKWRDKYEEIDGLGEGGNAKVYRVRCKDSKVEYALKELSAGGREKKSRFVKEIGIIKDNQENICGIVPIIEHSVEEYWYVMPVTESAMYYINRNNVEIINITGWLRSGRCTIEKGLWLFLWTCGVWLRRWRTPDRSGPEEAPRARWDW